MIHCLFPGPVETEAVICALSVSGILLFVLLLLTLACGEFPYERAVRCMVYFFLGSAYLLISAVAALVSWYTGTSSPALAFAAVVAACAASSVISAVTVTWAVVSKKRSIPATDR